MKGVFWGMTLFLLLVFLMSSLTYALQTSRILSEGIIRYPGRIPELHGAIVSAKTFRDPLLASNIWNFLSELNCNFLHTDVWGLTTQTLLDILEEARFRGIKVSLLLSHPDVGNHPAYGWITATYPYNPDLAIEIIDKFIKDTPLVGHPQIEYWIVINEPPYYMEDSAEGIAARNWLTRVMSHLKEVDPTHKVTFAADFWSIESLTAKHMDIISALPLDLIEVHFYSWMSYAPPRIDNSHEAYIEYLSRLDVLNKERRNLPIVLGEWGVCTHTGDLGYFVTEEQQAYFYENVLQAIKKSNIYGTSFYHADPDPGTGEFAGYSIIRMDTVTGTLSYKPAADVVRRHYRS